MSNLAGWYAGRLIDRGRTQFDARKRVMLLCAACLPITAVAGFTPWPWMVILWSAWPPEPTAAGRPTSSRSAPIASPRMP